MKNNPGSFYDLSNPSGSSVNDGINPESCSLSYISVDNVARVVASLGRGTMLKKTDIKSTYRVIPVHPADRLLLGNRMTMGMFLWTPDSPSRYIRSAPLIFTAVIDTVKWVVKQQEVQYLYHNLDDFITCRPPGTSGVRKYAQTLRVLWPVGHPSKRTSRKRLMCLL